LNTIKAIYFEFIDETTNSCKDKLEDEIETLTQVLDWEVINDFAAEFRYIEDSVKSEEEEEFSSKRMRTKERVTKLMTKKPFAFGVLRCGDSFFFYVVTDLLQ
jgi:hypothetical protein